MVAPDAKIEEFNISVSLFDEGSRSKFLYTKLHGPSDRIFCWMHSFKSFVENLGLCGVYFYYMSEYTFNKYYKCF